MGDKHLESESAGEDGADEDVVPAEEGVVDGVGELQIVQSAGERSWVGRGATNSHCEGLYAGTTTMGYRAVGGECFLV